MMLEEGSVSLVRTEAKSRAGDDDRLENVELDRESGAGSVKDGYFEQQTAGGEPLYMETPWYVRLYRQRCCLCIGLLVFIFFLWGVTSTNKACWAKMSAPHTSPRNVNSNLFLAHISDDSPTSEASQATLGKHPNQEIRFLVVGNFGRDGFCYQADNAQEMSRAARTMKAAFVISTGNVFFPSGIASADDPQIESSWRQVYNSQSLSSIKWYTALGEAEKLGDVNALLQFSRQDRRFIIDAPYYDRIFSSPSGTVTLHVFFLDTTSLIRTKKKQNDEQLQWLAEGLEKSNSTVKLVVGFHTPFADPILSDFLVPIIEDTEFGATAYFSGRERSLQWYKRKSAHYFISGAGAEMLKNENPFKNPLYVAPTSGFLACSVGLTEKTNEAHLKTAFVSSVGEVSKVIDTASH